MSRENIPPQQPSPDTAKVDLLNGELRSSARKEGKPLIEQIHDFLRRQRKIDRQDSYPQQDPFRDELL